jgi:hypothetical protein
MGMAVGIIAMQAHISVDLVVSFDDFSVILCE